MCRNLSKFNLRPKKSFGVDSSDELKQIDIEQLVKETMEILSGSSHEERSADKKKGNEDLGTNGCETLKKDTSHKRILENSKDDQFEISPARKICKCVGNPRDVHSSSKLLAGEEKASFTIEGSKTESRFPYVVFLGTGSSIPSKYRNVSSILLHAR